MEGISTLLYYPQKVMKTLDIIESKFDETISLPWMHRYWWLSIVFSITYVSLVFGGRHLMMKRSPMALRYALCMWSTVLAGFSIYACLKIYPMLINMAYYGGYTHVVCDTNYLIGSTHMGIWAWLFPLSKLPELFDTVFIILRKSKLSFLHWYHHFSVFIYCWYSYAYPISTGMMFGIVNYTVHAVMYAYYAVKASGRNPPRWVARAITTLQLSQMFVGLFLNFSAIYAASNGKACRIDWSDVCLSVFFYITYAILFANFYYWTYIHKRPSTVTPSTKGINNFPVDNKAIKSHLANGCMNGNGIVGNMYSK